jgi:hypothetical protein
MKIRKSTRRGSLIADQLRTDQIELVEKNKKLAKFYCRKHRNWGRLSKDVDFDDRTQAAMLGICLAALKFKEEKCKFFASYAKHWIRSSLQRFSDSDHPVYIPAHSVCKIQSVVSTANRISVRNGPENAVRYLHWAMDRYSLWKCWTVLGHNKVEPDEIEIKEKKGFDEELLSALSEREQLVIRYRFGINTEERTLEYIADNFLGGISRERVRQIERDALRKLKAKYEG